MMMIKKVKVALDYQKTEGKVESNFHDVAHADCSRP